MGYPGVKVQDCDVDCVLDEGEQRHGAEVEDEGAAG